MGAKILLNKKILFICLETFNYEKEINEKLISLGASVDYFDERPSNSIFTKSIIRVKKSLYKKKIHTYYLQILNGIKHNKYDFFFLIKGEVIPIFFLRKLKKLSPKCEFIYYTWDSFENNLNAISILPFFDKKMSFDNKDAFKYGLEFRPLFFIDKYRELSKSNSTNFKYDLLFIGTAHSDRYRLGKIITKWCNEYNFKIFTYYYMQSKIVYFIKLLFQKSFKSYNYSKLNFKSLSTKQVISFYKKSKIIIDINHPNQRGLTMRTFETLGAGKKLITTNSQIKKYSFYNDQNIFILDRENILMSRDFLKSPFKKIDDDLVFEMSISGWIKSIFIENKDNYWINKYK